jgi:hypothetical protein
MSIRKSLKKRLQPVKSWLLDDLERTATDSSLVLGRMASWQVRSQQKIVCLQDVEFKINSQWGEDGIIDWLVERCNIPRSLHSFVEFGVEDYREANSRFLMQNRHWRGLILDGSSKMIDRCKHEGFFWKYDLTAKAAFITRDNINELISTSGFNGDIGLLSVDLDGNDYWIWEAIEAVRPIICICEYNAVFGDIHPISVPYAPAFDRTQAHFTNLYFGASIVALRNLASNKGYRFVGTTTAANDAFFVREDYAGNFVDTAIQNIRALPSCARESRDSSGELTYIGGLNRLHTIADLSVLNTDTRETVRLGDLKSVYSDEWLRMMTGAATESSAP